MQVRVVAAEGEMQGQSRVVDLHNGLYEVFYTAPATGAFLVHVEYADAGVNPVPIGIRGSPFAVQCTDPWTKFRVLGALPARRAVSQTSAACSTPSSCDASLIPTPFAVHMPADTGNKQLPCCSTRWHHC